MPYKLKIEELEVHCTVSGDFTGNEFIQINNEITSLHNFSKLKYQLFNFQSTNKFSANSDDIRKVAEQDAALYKVNPNMKIAIVSNELVIKGLTNMYNIYFEISCDNTSWESEIFESEENAYKWLNT